jgi:hypothetical protein
MKLFLLAIARAASIAGDIRGCANARKTRKLSERKKKESCKPQQKIGLKKLFTGNLRPKAVRGTLQGAYKKACKSLRRTPKKQQPS